MDCLLQKSRSFVNTRLGSVTLLPSFSASHVLVAMLAKSFSSQVSFSPCAVPVIRCTSVANHARLSTGRRNTRNSATLQSGLNKDDPRDVVFSRDSDDTIFVFPFS